LEPRQPGQEPECTSSPGGSIELLGLDSARGGAGIAVPESREPTLPQPAVVNAETTKIRDSSLDMTASRQKGTFES
jgi:hypothetical protein